MGLDPSTKLSRDLMLHTLSFLSMEDLQNAQVNSAYKDMVDEVWFDKGFKGYPIPEGHTPRQFFQKREVKPLIDEVRELVKSVEINQARYFTIRFNKRRDYVITIVMGCGLEEPYKKRSVVLADSPSYPEGFDAVYYKIIDSDHSRYHRTLIMGSDGLSDISPFIWNSRSHQIGQKHIKLVGRLDHPLPKQIISLLETRMREMKPDLFPRLPVREHLEYVIAGVAEHRIDVLINQRADRARRLEERRINERLSHIYIIGVCLILLAIFPFYHKLIFRDR